MLEPDAPYPQTPSTGVTPTKTNEPTMGVLQPQTATAVQLAQASTFPDIKATGRGVLLKP
jgi:hypothetical protein